MVVLLVLHAALWEERERERNPRNDQQNNEQIRLYIPVYQHVILHNACDETTSFFLFLKKAYFYSKYFGPCFESLSFSILSIRKEDIEHVRIITGAIISESQVFAVRSPNPKPVGSRKKEKSSLD